MMVFGETHNTYLRNSHFNDYHYSSCTETGSIKPVQSFSLLSGYLCRIASTTHFGSTTLLCFPSGLPLFMTQTKFRLRRCLLSPLVISFARYSCLLMVLRIAEAWINLLYSKPSESNSLNRLVNVMHCSPSIKYVSSSFEWQQTASFSEQQLHNPHMHQLSDE